MKPFNLEQALAGEPILTRDRQKGFVKFVIENDKNNVERLVGVVHNGSVVEVEKWFPGGNVLTDDTAPNDIIGMWEEPRPRVTLTLPCPLKEPHEGMWYISTNNRDVYKSGYCKGQNSSFNEDELNAGRYFATKEDAEEWVNAMRGARR